MDVPGVGALTIEYLVRWAEGPTPGAAAIYISLPVMICGELAHFRLICYSL